MEKLGNSMPMAEGMVDAEGGSMKSDLSDVCLNCGSELSGGFCWECGQKNIPRRQTLGELFENFPGSFFSYDSKFIRTIKYLLFRPGFLVTEYNSGKRERYYHPARMYVFISAVYLLCTMKIVYRQRRGKTISKFLILSFTFFICLGLGLFLNLAITLLFF